MPLLVLADIKFSPNFIKIPVTYRLPICTHTLIDARYTSTRTSK
jgi:hypothetical protein